MGEEEEEEARHDIFYKSEERKKKACKEWELLSYRTCSIKVTIRDAEDIASELIALVCSIKLITEGSLCPKTDETVLLADVPVCKYPSLTAFFTGLQASPD